LGEQNFNEIEVRRLLGLCRRLATAGTEVAARKQLFLSELCRVVGAVAGLTAMLGDDFSVEGELTVVRIDPTYNENNNVADEFAAITTVSLNQQQESPASYPINNAVSSGQSVTHASSIADAMAINGADIASGDDAATAVLAGHGRDVFGNGNPLVRPLIREAASRLFEPTALARAEAVDDKEWYSSEFFRQCRVPFGLDDCILSVVPLPGLQPFINVVCLSGPLRDESIADPSVPPSPYFSPRQRRVVEFAHSELRWIHYPQDRGNVSKVLASDAPAAPVDPENSAFAAQLSPRYRRVLRHLLTGESEKEIASQLGLSRHTIHEYVRALYRQFSVTSRSELMAQWVQSQTAAGAAQ
jgi:DNA-binding CsgD family transcriptional regulator